MRSPQGRPPRKNTYETIEELMENAIGMHLRAAEQFAGLLDSTDNPRVRLLLQNIVRYEQELEMLLREFLGKADHNTRVTWLQYTQEVHPEEMLRSVMPPQGSELTEENLGKASQDLHEYFVLLFETAVSETASEKAQQMLRDVLQLERARRRQFTRVINSLMDM